MMIKRKPVFTSDDTIETKKDKIVEYFAYIQSKDPDEPLTVKIVYKYFSRNTIESVVGGLGILKKEIEKRYPEHVNYDIKLRSTTKRDLIAWYIALYKKIGHTPSKAEIAEDGKYTFGQIVSSYGALFRLEKECRKLQPESFHDISIKDIRVNSRIRELRDTLKGYNKFIITTAVTGCKVNLPFLNSLRRLAKDKKAKLLILLCSDPARPKDSCSNDVIDKELLEETIILEDSQINSNLFVSSIKLSAKQQEPLRGLGNISKKYGSFIFASPKIGLEYHSVGNDKTILPHFTSSTGAITLPDYDSNMYMAQRRAYIAEHSHNFGAAYVEVQNSKIFHFTQIECKNKDGSLFLRDQMYTPTTKKKAKAKAFIMGDLHSGFTCSKSRQNWIEVIEATKPEMIAIHDGFNGYSVNQHIKDDYIAQAIRAMHNLDDLQAELIHFAKEIEFWASKCDQLIMVPSNHNDWLSRYLRKGLYIKDPKNHLIGAKLAVAMLEKKDPLRYAVEEIAGIKADNIYWPNRNEDIIIGGVQINCHGDITVGGGKGSLAGMRSSYIASFSGHTHTAAISGDAWQVGTSGVLQEEYNNGASKWTNTSGLLYVDGSRALVNSIFGNWKVE